jgi:hypothetical protein
VRIVRFATSERDPSEEVAAVQPTDCRPNLPFGKVTGVITGLEFEDTLRLIAERASPNLLTGDAYWFFACSNLAVYRREDSQFWIRHPFVVVHFKNPVFADSHSSIRAMSAFEVFYEACDASVVSKDPFYIPTT